MGDTKFLSWKRVLLGSCLLVLVPVALVVRSLFLVRTTPIEYREPPEIHFAQVEATPDSRLAGDRIVETLSEESTSDSSANEMEVGDVEVVDTAFRFEDLVRDRDFNRLTKLLIHQDQDVRLAAAQAFADSFNGYIGDREARETLDRFRDEYWKAVNFESEETKMAIKETFYEALIEQVKAGDHPNQLNVVMNLWVYLDPPTGETKKQDEEAFEVVAWIADVHPDPMSRYAAARRFRYDVDGFYEQRQAGLDAIRRDPSLEVRFYVFMDDLERVCDPIVYGIKSRI